MIDNMEAPENDLKNRKGKIKLNRYLIREDPNEKQLKALFSNFFPVNIETTPWDDIMIIHGYSPLFRKINEEEMYPEYIAYLKSNDDLSISLDRMEEVAS
ncbi:MAG: hypothetical protein V4721_10555 [Bacteroidota bacterium]